MSKEVTTTDTQKTEEKFLSPRGLDVGTMNLVSAILKNPKASPKDAATKRTRNNYIKIENTEDFDVTRYSHVVIDGETFILGEDAFKLANVFNNKVSRCMSQGLIAAGDLDGMDVVSAMISGLVGRGDKQTKCVFSVPADPIDKETDNKYHENFFSHILQKLDWVPVPLNEAMAVVLSELDDDDCTGIGISFGAGMTNVCIAYQGIIVKQFSVAMGGDWIDQQSATMTRLAVNRMTALKEKKEFSIINPQCDKKEMRRHMEIIASYYRALITDVTRAIMLQFSSLTAQFPDAIPVVISGGTSMADGFAEAVHEIFQEHEFPFEISEVRVSNDSMYAVARGCLIHALRQK